MPGSLITLGGVFHWCEDERQAYLVVRSRGEGRPWNSQDTLCTLSPSPWLLFLAPLSYYRSFELPKVSTAFFIIIIYSLSCIVGLGYGST